MTWEVVFSDASTKFPKKLRDASTLRISAAFFSREPAPAKW